MSKSSTFANIPARVSLYLLATTCIAVGFILRTTMGITILAMVKETRNHEYLAENVSKMLCYVRNGTVDIQKSYGGTFQWSIDVQYYILTSYFWTYIGGQVIGGMSAHKFGAKIVIGVGMFISAVSNMCIPFGSEMSNVVVIILQLFNGLGSGVVWPALYSLVSWWIPKHEQGNIVVMLLPSIFATYVAKAFFKSLDPAGAWQVIFYSSGLVLLTSFLFYLAFASADAQAWDYKIVPTDADEQQLDQQLAEERDARR